MLKKIIVFSMFFIPIQASAQYRYLTPRQAFYYYASYGDMQSLQSLMKQGYSIESQDSQGNTALCEAILKSNNKAVRTLLKLGANRNSQCMQKIARYYQQIHSVQTSALKTSSAASVGTGATTETFLGIGTVGWTGIGLAVAGVGVAAAAGGGGGGGGSSSSSGYNGNTSSTKYLDNESITDTDNGQEIVGKTISANNPDSIEEHLNNANNDTIKKVVNSESAVSGIASESVSTYNVLSFDKNQNANIVIAQRGSGDVYGIKGPQSNYVVVTNDDDDAEIYNAVIADSDDGVAAGHVIGNITIRNTGAGTGNVYGMQSQANNVYIANALAESESSASSATGNILIENINSDKNIYGIYSSADAANAESDDNAKANANITIKNGCDGDVYGIKAVKETYNIDATDSSEAIARIDITSKGDGNIYGISNESVLYNVATGHERWEDEDKDSAKATATINIESTGTGNVYGLKSFSDIFNAYSYYNSNATGKIRISNNGSGDAFGIYGNNTIKNASAHSEGSSYHATAKGYVNLLNKSFGNVYGLYSNMSGNYVMNNSEYDEQTQQSIIELANIGNGLAVGMYSKDGMVENSGDIKVHNLGGGVAVGIYADGTTNVTNSGTITIDRARFVDTLDGNKVYSASSSKGGKAVGIYGTAGSSINNSGTINISGADESYGIYSEGSNVTNIGTINIDGVVNGNNAIKLNGGELLQDGIIYAGGDWYDPCRSVTCGANATCNAGVCLCNSGYEGNPNTGCTVINNEEYIAKRININDGVNNSNISLTKSTSGNVIGLNIISFSGSNALNGTANVTVTQNGSGAVFGVKANAKNADNYDDDLYFVNANAWDNSIAHGGIKIINNGEGTGNIYGIDVLDFDTNYNEDDRWVDNALAEDAGNATGMIDITNTSNKNVYGIAALSSISNAEGDDQSTVQGKIKINNTGNGHVYGLYYNGAKGYADIQQYQVAGKAYNVDTTDNSVSTGIIEITNNGTNNVYGIYSKGVVYNVLSGHWRYNNDRDMATGIGVINVENEGNGNVYGIYSDSIVYNSYAYYGSKADAKVRVSNGGTGKIYGILGEYIVSSYVGGADFQYTPKATSLINLINKGNGFAYGIYGQTIENNSSGSNMTSRVQLANIGDGLAVGIYSKDGMIENSGDIKIHNLGDGVAVGIYADGTTNVTNSGTITIDRASYTDDMATADTADDVPYTASSSTTDIAIGIYGAAGSTITNTIDGKIYINSASTAYGIYTEGNESSVTNNGTILINGLSSENAIHTNGGTLFQNGTLYVTNNSQNSLMSVSSVKPASLNLNDFGGTVVASDTSQFIVEGAISGDLAINNSVIENGFDTTYSVKDMIQAEDTSGLNLYSQSALFDATLQNNTDAVMTMKAFNNVVENSSVADFLQNNYVANNNEDLFKTLKSAETVAQLNSNIDDLFGKNMFSRMAFEDLSMIREVSFDMNNHLFEKEGAFAFGENISPSSYNKNLGSVKRYSLNGYNNGNLSFGVGVSITDVRIDDGNRDNRRFDRNFMMSAPIGYKTHGFELITAPKMGYADGTYDRQGFNNMTYDGKIQKRMFALMNETRYPLKFGGMKLIPSAEFNMIGYNIKGHEDEKQYALRIKSQNHYSVEAGFGLMAEKEFKPYKNHKFNINGGVAVYHEFANPYELEVGMSGMDGYYKLQDEKRSDNRAVVRFGFGYELKDNVDVSASWLTNIDREYRTDAKIDLKYHF